MRPLLQHASRSLIANANASVVPPSSRLLPDLVRGTRSICAGCQHRTASAHRRGAGAQWNSNASEKWSRRFLTSSAIWRQDGKPPNPNDPIAMPPPASHSTPTQPPTDRIASSPPSPQDQERLQRRLDALLEDQKNIKKAAESSVAALQEPPANETQELPPPDPPQEEPPTSSNKNEPLENIARVPDEQLPSHRERQRWNLSKRFSEAMDDLLPKLATVTQKVNTYTGTDYSGVEALRREIKDQEKLVKSRRAAIDSSKQALDTALAHQASSQKEVVALLERKHSWSSGDLERYMALIRSEHINDQAVREAKDAVANAENALEDARAQLEKRERAQYHEEQIWSDTIRRNSTWVTFGLMGVNIFLLLLSLAILEPWRRRRMVREIKNALDAQLAAMEVPSASTPVEALAATAPTPVESTTPAPVEAAAPAPAQQNLAVIEEEIDRTLEHAQAVVEPEVPAEIEEEKEEEEELIEESPTAGTGHVPPMEPEFVPVAMPGTMPESTPLEATSEPTPSTPDAAPAIPQRETYAFTEEIPADEDIRAKLERWQQKASVIAQDVVSERVVSMRRIDYTTAILQGAAAGAVITAAIIELLRSG